MVSGKEQGSVPEHNRGSKEVYLCVAGQSHVRSIEFNAPGEDHGLDCEPVGDSVLLAKG